MQHARRKRRKARCTYLEVHEPQRIKAPRIHHGEIIARTDRGTGHHGAGADAKKGNVRGLEYPVADRAQELVRAELLEEAEGVAAACV